MGLHKPQPGTPQEIVRRLAAVQAQDFAGAKWAIGMRLAGATDVGLEEAFNEGAILRTHLLRPTWHFVAPEDIHGLLALTGPRVHAVNKAMYTRLGLGATEFHRGQNAMAAALQGGRSLTRDELAAVLLDAGVDADSGQRLAYLMMHAELDGVICSGPRRGRQFTYGLLEERAPATGGFDRGDALTTLARRYFETRGPATIQDFAKWSGLTVAEARRGLEGARVGLHHAVVEGETFWLSPGPVPRRGKAPSAHLISIYDEYISSYKDRRAIVSEVDSARLVGKGNALTAVVLIDGRIVGTWRRTILRDHVAVEVEPFRRWTEAETAAVDAGAQKYGRFHGLPAVLRGESRA